MFKLKPILKCFSVFLAVIMIFTGVSNSFVFAQEFNSSSEIVTFDEGVFLYERITNHTLGEILKITNLDTNEEQIVFRDGNNIYLKNEDGEILEVARIEKNESILYSIASDDWVYFGPDRFDFDLEGITSVTIVAGIIAFAIGGPVLAIKAALGSLTAGSVYNGVYAYKSGRYKFVGSGVQGEYTSQLYQPSGKTLGPLIPWSGKR